MKRGISKSVQFDCFVEKKSYKGRIVFVQTERPVSTRDVCFVPVMIPPCYTCLLYTSRCV